MALWTRPSLLLGEVMSEEQLVQLVRLAVLKDQRVSTWGSPWACHAITCLLQDMLEGDYFVQFSLTLSMVHRLHYEVPSKISLANTAIKVTISSWMLQRDN